MVRVSSSGFPHPSYLRTVLKPNFEHSVRHFFQPLIEINRAHAIMLARCGIIPNSHAQRILKALKQIASDEKQLLSYRFQGVEEDLFFHIERRLEALCGSEVAGHLSVARSRNDIDITLYRMVLRNELLHASRQVTLLHSLLLELSSRHIDTLFPVVTHTQLAQPTTLAHYLFDYASRVLELLTQVLASMTVDRERALARCQSSGITFTELADSLVRDHRLPFRTAHGIVSRVASGLRQRPSRRKGEPWADAVSDLTARFSREATEQEIRIPPRQMSSILDPVRFVAARKAWAAQRQRQFATAYAGISNGMRIGAAGWTIANYLCNVIRRPLRN